MWVLLISFNVIHQDLLHDLSWNLDWRISEAVLGSEIELLSSANEQKVDDGWSGLSSVFRVAIVEKREKSWKNVFVVL